MANKVKKLASFSPDAIETGLLALTCKAKQQFVETLDLVLQNMAKASKEKKETKKNKFTDVRYFKEKILPQIRMKLAEIEAEDNPNGFIDLGNCNLSVFEEIKNIKETDIAASAKQLHATLLNEERKVGVVALLFTYYRGVFYDKLKFAYDNKAPGTYKEYVSNELGITYDLAQQHIRFSRLIKKWPRLVLCGLSRAQLDKHRIRLQEYLEQEDDELNEKLGLVLNLKLATETITIDAEETVLTGGAVNVDPDYLAYGDPDYEAEEDFDHPEDQ